ncbi:MAG: hypothetical protein ACI83W_000238 [Marinoscillum sp.]|jgi:hypothetical protein
MDFIGQYFLVCGGNYFLSTQEVCEMRKYLMFATLTSVCLILLYYFLNDFLFRGALHVKFPALVFFFFLQSLMIGWLLYQGEKVNWETPIYVLAAITFRFLTALFFLVILFVMKIEDLRSLMIQFIVLYLGYLIFELIAVLPNLRRN